MESILTNFSEAHRLLSYLIIILGIFFEGEIVLILAGVLSHKGYLDIFDVMIIAFGAAIVHDLIYWSIGKKISEAKKKKFLFFNLEKVGSHLEKLKTSNGLYIFISKFAWSFNRIILIISGYLKMPIDKLLRYSLPACFIWSITFVSIGYVFSLETNLLKKDLKTAIIFLTGFIFVVVLFENILRRILVKRGDI